jgi:DNA polymerase-1
MLRVAERLEKEHFQAKLVLQVHDELVIDCPIEEAEKVSELLKTEMETAVSLRVPLTVEISSGKTWFDTK